MQLSFPTFPKKAPVKEFTIKAQNEMDEKVLSAFVSNEQSRIYVLSYTSAAPDGRIVAITFRGMK